MIEHVLAIASKDAPPDGWQLAAALENAR